MLNYSSSRKLLIVGKRGKQFIVQQQYAWIFIVLCQCNT